MIRPKTPEESATCEAILRKLPAWFGIEEAIVEYRKDIETLPTLVAEVDGEIVGFCTYRFHNQFSGEIQVIGVLPEYHRHGWGRALIDAVELIMREQNTIFMQVKTLGPGRPDEGYDKTRQFYRGVGFYPLEETDLWGETNPCLIMVKHLGD